MQTDIDLSTFLTEMLFCVSDILYASPYYDEKGKWMQEPQLVETISETPT